ncbi:SDR family NAD(P)-dependent oxidoreductase [Streptomyces sp. NRRL F-5630]|uniref:SDR family NAD(P)-dependent oxidoreductase n=1 Tax=unclassified Streptomyces TaxID=2593676 RepID=UPI0004CB7160|nr:SDR family NAD(P)-dependent oxidoreductase [Streptomyces sp. NRRL F-5630]
MSQVFLVTGSSRGLGRALVETALKAGHRVLATARDPRALDDMRAAYGDALATSRHDVTDPAAAERVVAEAVERFGRLDVLVNNAGQADLVTIEDTDIDVFRRQMDTNFYGVVYTSRAVLPVLREQGGGHIVQVSSVGGRVASPGLSAYQSAKWAVGGFSEVLAAETASFGVKVTVIEPGGMRTDWGAASMRVPEASGPYQDLMAEAAKLRKDFDTRAPGDPVRVARAILTVASLDEPPVRLLLGSDAYAYGRAAWSGRVAEDAKWEELSRSTDFPTTER